MLLVEIKDWHQLVGLYMQVMNRNASRWMTPEEERVLFDSVRGGVCSAKIQKRIRAYAKWLNEQKEIRNASGWMTPEEERVLFDSVRGGICSARIQKRIRAYAKWLNEEQRRPPNPFESSIPRKQQRKKRKRVPKRRRNAVRRCREKVDEEGWQCDCVVRKEAADTKPVTPKELSSKSVRRFTVWEAEQLLNSASSFGLQIRHSTIPSAGFGLFTTKNFARNSAGRTLRLPYEGFASRVRKEESSMGVLLKSGEYLYPGKWNLSCWANHAADNPPACNERSGAYCRNRTFSNARLTEDGDGKVSLIIPASAEMDNVEILCQYMVDEEFNGQIGVIGGRGSKQTIGR